MAGLWFEVGAVVALFIKGHAFQIPTAFVVPIIVRVIMTPIGAVTRQLAAELKCTRVAGADIFAQEQERQVVVQIRVAIAPRQVAEISPTQILAKLRALPVFKN